ncbi:MAG: enoyl-CoA hydratase-related protein [Parvibaculaceae bacterium]
MPKTFEHITLEKEDGIATITLNRPDAMNSIHAAMMMEICEAFDVTDADDQTKAVIVTGSGNRSFSAGADLSNGADIFRVGSKTGARKVADAEAASVPDLSGVPTLRIFSSLKPVIGAVNGVAVGLGVTLLLPMDFRIASSSARFGFVFCRRGIVPDAASSWFLPRLVGVPMALDLIYSGRIIGSEEAAGIGLVSEITEPEDLMTSARRRAHSYIDGTSPVSISISRRLVWEMQAALHPREAHIAESRALAVRSRSADVVEGVNSFLEKRPPKFTDLPSEKLPRYLSSK